MGAGAVLGALGVPDALPDRPLAQSRWLVPRGREEGDGLRGHELGDGRPELDVGRAGEQLAGLDEATLPADRVGQRRGRAQRGLAPLGKVLERVEHE